MKKTVFIPGIWKTRSVKSIAFKHYYYIIFSAFTEKNSGQTEASPNIASTSPCSIQTRMLTGLPGYLNAVEENLKALIIKNFLANYVMTLPATGGGKALYGS